MKITYKNHEIEINRVETQVSDKAVEINVTHLSTGYLCIGEIYYGPETIRDLMQWTKNTIDEELSKPLPWGEYVNDYETREENKRTSEHTKKVVNTPSPRMDEFLDKVDALCFEYGYEFYPTTEGWTGRKNEKGEYETFACIGHGEKIKLMYIDGDGRGK